uniref:Uncharacterized protein n=1 Tax=Physcomitrium patens TaxID=3218 RepID=A0A2K1IQB6_PHYPA|nr:hypothetical protein PHYPA_025595 [Physcomitrium patens]
MARLQSLHRTTHVQLLRSDAHLDKRCIFVSNAEDAWYLMVVWISELSHFIDIFSMLLRVSRCGDAGHRSPYLSHAKRALYRLSYIPTGVNSANISISLEGRPPGYGARFEWRTLSSTNLT